MMKRILKNFLIGVLIGIFMGAISYVFIYLIEGQENFANEIIKIEYGANYCYQLVGTGFSGGIIVTFIDLLAYIPVYINKKDKTEEMKLSKMAVLTAVLLIVLIVITFFAIFLTYYLLKKSSETFISVFYSIMVVVMILRICGRVLDDVIETKKINKIIISKVNE